MDIQMLIAEIALLGALLTVVVAVVVNANLRQDLLAKKGQQIRIFGILSTKGAVIVVLMAALIGGTLFIQQLGTTSLVKQRDALVYRTEQLRAQIADLTTSLRTSEDVRTRQERAHEQQERRKAQLKDMINDLEVRLKGEKWVVNGILRPSQLEGLLAWYCAYELRKLTVNGDKIEEDLAKFLRSTKLDELEEKFQGFVHGVMDEVSELQNFSLFSAPDRNGSLEEWIAEWRKQNESLTNQSVKALTAVLVEERHRAWFMAALNEDDERLKDFRQMRIRGEKDSPADEILHFCARYMKPMHEQLLEDYTTIWREAAIRYSEGSNHPMQPPRQVARLSGHR